MRAFAQKQTRSQKQASSATDRSHASPHAPADRMQPMQRLQRAMLYQTTPQMLTGGTGHPGSLAGTPASPETTEERRRYFQPISPASSTAPPSHAGNAGIGAEAAAGPSPSVSPGFQLDSARAAGPPPGQHDSAPIYRSAADLDGIIDHTVATGLADRARSSTGQALPAALRAQLEHAVDGDLGAVRVHAGGASSLAAAALRARAYTVGTDIHFAAGRYDPVSPAGRRLIAHEVAHAAWHGGRRGGEPSVSTPGDSEERDAERFSESFVGPAPRDNSPGEVPRTVGRAAAKIYRDPEDDAAADLLQRTALDRSGLARELVRLLDPSATQVRNEGIGRGAMMDTSRGAVWDSWGGSVQRHTVPFITAIRALRRLQRGFLPAAQETATQVVEQLGRTRLAQLADSYDGRQAVQVLYELVPGSRGAAAQLVQDAIADANRALQPAVAGSTALADRVHGLVALPMSFSWNAMGDSPELDLVATEVLALSREPGFAQLPPHLQAAFVRSASTVARALGDREAQREAWRDRLAGIRPASISQTRPPVAEQLRAITGMGAVGAIATLGAFAAGADTERAIAVGQAADALFLVAMPAARGIGGFRAPAAAGGGGLVLTNQNPVELVQPGRGPSSAAPAPAPARNPATAAPAPAPAAGQPVPPGGTSAPPAGQTRAPARAATQAVPFSNAAEEADAADARQPTTGSPGRAAAPRQPEAQLQLGAGGGVARTAPRQPAGQRAAAGGGGPAGRVSVPGSIGSSGILPIRRAANWLPPAAERQQGRVLYVYIIYGTLNGRTRVLRVGMVTGDPQTRIGGQYGNLPAHPEVRRMNLELSMEVHGVRLTEGRITVTQVEREVRVQVGRGPWDHGEAEGGRLPGSAIPVGPAVERLRWTLDADLRWHPPDT